MAGSRFAYVRNFELPDPLLPGTYMVFRLDGHSFHRFSDEHKFTKPNDDRALKLMDHAARAVMDAYPDIVLGFGESDEYSFLLRKSTQLYNRRHAKIVTTLTSYFTSSYVFHWRDYFPDLQLRYPPSFDGRIVLYPSEREVKDYFAWRQVDTHINNLYNTAFWALVQQGEMSTKEAHATLSKTVSSEKHEIMHSRFGINYNEVNMRFRKGSVLVREEVTEPVIEDPVPSLPTDTPEVTEAMEAPANVGATSGTEVETPQNSNSNPSPPKEKKKSKAKAAKEKEKKTEVVLRHCDVIKDEFWEERRYLLEG
ncbi:tRNAHis guanylyltransferase [Stereum hirsutum FP-91666 SS1]|uniref:tRNAHis guanylyltransferase n=1 Tax=Stereum hirsutum (strain FP-91666) TaxID=721885 RepID=UPI000444A412|nr:tRNAHis guanylyltransferase [Stereum hirsutum FP-91666 SS1]EIM82530.1 tRNAHis guanylyltransferase [Stereum hirsutum FP-91666 SS1]